MNDQGTLPECSSGEQFAILPKGTEVGCGMCHAAQFDLVDVTTVSTDLKEP